jgi:hypothetical protein
MFRLTRSMLLMCLLFGMGAPAWASDESWEYKVVILQGVTVGGTIKEIASGVSVDTKKTKSLNELASDGWEVISVIGSLVADHVVYLRREVR